MPNRRVRCLVLLLVLRRGKERSALAIRCQGHLERNLLAAQLHDPAFIDAFNACLAGHPVYPLNLRMFKDPDWNALSELQPEGSEQVH